MNKNRKKLITIGAMLLILLALTILLLMNLSVDSLKGSWHISTLEGYDMSFEAKDMSLEKTTVVFNGRGTCIYKGLAEDIEAEYKITDETIDFKDDQSEYTGKIQDENILVIDNFFDTGLKVTLVRDEAVK